MTRKKKFINLFYMISEVEQNKATVIVYSFPMQADEIVISSTGYVQYMYEWVCIYLLCIVLVFYKLVCLWARPQLYQEAWLCIAGCVWILFNWMQLVESKKAKSIPVDSCIVLYSLSFQFLIYGRLFLLSDCVSMFQ